MIKEKNSPSFDFNKYTVGKLFLRRKSTDTNIKSSSDMVGESVVGVDGGWSGVGASSLKNQTIMLRTKRDENINQIKMEKKKLYFFSSCSCSCSCL